MRTAHCHLCDRQFRTTSEDDHLCGRCEDAVEPWEERARAEGYRQGLERAALQAEFEHRMGGNALAAVEAIRALLEKP